MTTEPTLPTTGVQSLSPSHHNQMDDSELSKLYHSLKHIVWVIKLETKKKDASLAMGFCVTADGLIMTKAKDLLGASIEVWRLYSEDDNDMLMYTAKVKKMDRKINIALLEVEGCDNFAHGTFPVDGSLLVGESLLFLGNPIEFVGSFFIGRNVFHCPETDNQCVTLLTDGDLRKQTCGEYVSDTTNVTPDYRLLGHIYNKEKYENLEGEEQSDGASLKFEKQLHPLTPIIQCNGFGFIDSSEGGPVFNKKGDVVGMLIYVAKDYHFAIHVSMLKSFLKKVQEEDNVQWSK